MTIRELRATFSTQRGKPSPDITEGYFYPPSFFRTAINVKTTARAPSRIAGTQKKPKAGLETDTAAMTSADIQRDMQMIKRTKNGIFMI